MTHFPFDILRETPEQVERRTARLKAARNAPRGIEKPEIGLGAIVTLSANTETGDKSWTGEVWEVVAISGPNVGLKCIWPPKSWLREQPIMVRIAEHEFYPAEEFAQAMLAETKAEGA